MGEGVGGVYLGEVVRGAGGYVGGGGLGRGSRGGG